MSYSNSPEGFLRDSDGVVTVKRVLLIEEHALFRQGLARPLSWELGLESIDAGSLAEGHRVLGAAKGMADLAIIELDLPGRERERADRTAAPERTRRSDSGL